MGLKMMLKTCGVSQVNVSTVCLSGLCAKENFAITRGWVLYFVYSFVWNSWLANFHVLFL